jgi:2-phospho-L-lactate guanylyltransferase
VGQASILAVSRPRVQRDTGVCWDDRVEPASRWVVLVPIKSLEEAKTRLGEARPRADLALAFARDTVRAAGAVAEVVVVTDDPVVTRAAHDLGARTVGQGPRHGLNAALSHGAAQVRTGAPDVNIAALAGDLPALRPDELARALRAAESHDRACVSDAEGTGTTLLTARAGIHLDPVFGPRSRAAHRLSGAVELLLTGVPGLRRDVDDEVGLWDARRLGVGPATTAALAHTDT